jgi:lambda family phage portal protein
MSHLKLVKRWPATRGISLFSTVISRLYDVKDLEESERIKNRILASWTAALTKSPDVPGYEAVSESGSRYLEMAGGTIIDSLAPGESITGVGPDYPVANLPDYLNDQYRRIASGTGTRHSSIAKNYNGTYAAQRQEMVESEGHYQIREDTFVAKVVRTVYERWLLAAIADGQVALVGDQDIEMAANAEYRGPITPWIDPLKEAQADALMVAEGFASIDQIRIKRGAPAEMIGTPAPAKPQPAPQSSPAQLSLIEGDDDEEDAA